MTSPAGVYFWLEAGTVLLPLLLSFDQKVHYYRRFRFLIPAIFLPLIPFVIWDWLFTEAGIWWFSDTYTLGLKLGPLPLEEWGFFVAVPFGCLFIYDCLNRWLPWESDGRWVRRGTLWGVGLVLFIGLLFYERLYTSVTAVSFAVAWGLHLAVHGWQWAGRIWRAWALCQIPFFAVNGVLTSLPVVSYNDAQNLGLRIGSIPAEDTFYGMTLFLLNVTVYEYVQRRTGVPAPGTARTKVAA